MPQLIEQLIAPKTGDPAQCEDGLFTGAHYIAVIDGVTSKPGTRWNGKTGGFLAKEAILRALPELAPEASCEQGILFLNDALKRAYGSRYEQARSDRSLRMQANCILYSIRRREIWAFGDCCCRLRGKIYSHKKRVDAVVEQARALYLELALLRGETEQSLMRNDPGRAFIMPLLEQQYLLANGVGPFAYPVLDGFPIHPEQTVVYQVGPGEEVVLASDGYPLLLQTLEKSEAALRRILKEDPLCMREYPSTKARRPGAASYDDRTYIRFIAD